MALGPHRQLRPVADQGPQPRADRAEFQQCGRCRPGRQPIVCRPGYTSSPFPTGSSTCAPLNLFGGNQASQAALDYITGYSTPRSVNTQWVGTATMNGAFFDLPGGPLGFAVGYEHRRELFNSNRARCCSAVRTPISPPILTATAIRPMTARPSPATPASPRWSAVSTRTSFSRASCADLLAGEWHTGPASAGIAGRLPLGGAFDRRRRSGLDGRRQVEPGPRHDLPR